MADENIQNTNNEPDVNTNEPENNTPSVEELLSQIAQLKADSAKNKSALDKALKEKGEITKRLREKQTAEEAEAEARTEAEAERAEREAEKDKIIARYEAEKRFLSMGMKDDVLESAVEAKLNGDEDALFSIINKFYENKANADIKAKENEWLGNRPPVNVGVGGNATLTKEQFNKMGYKARVELANNNPELYKQLTS